MVTGLGSVFELGLGSDLVGFSISGRGSRVEGEGSGGGVWIGLDVVVEGESFS